MGTLYHSTTDPGLIRAAREIASGRSQKPLISLIGVAEATRDGLRVKAKPPHHLPPPQQTFGSRSEARRARAARRGGAEAGALHPARGRHRLAPPANKKENRGSPALCVSGNFQGKQRVFGAPFWKLASFPESESWSGAKSEAKLRNRESTK